MNAVTSTAAIARVPLVDAFRLRAWARGYLASIGEITLQEAVDVLQADAEAQGLVAAIGQDAVQAILAEGFAEDRAMTDWNYHQERQQGDDARPNGSGSWDEPDESILDDRRGELPPFPSDCLPLEVQAWAGNAAHAAGVTVDHVVIPLLGVASGLIGTARRIRAARAYTSPATMWLSLVGQSGTGKTPGAGPTVRALAHVEKHREPWIVKLRQAHESKVAKARAEHKKWMTAVAEAVLGNKPPPPMPEAAVAPGPFEVPRLSVTNVTAERMPGLLRARPSGLLLLCDELSSLFLNMGRYANGGTDRGFWLAAWDGNRYTVERMSRSEDVEHLLIGMTGGFQPDRLAKSFGDDADGLYARMLFSWPAEPHYRRLTDDMEELSVELINAMVALVNLSGGLEDQVSIAADEELLNKAEALAGRPGTKGEGAAARAAADRIKAKLARKLVLHVQLTHEAREAFEDFRKLRFQVQQGLSGREREWWCKSELHVLRLALTLCFLEWAMVPGDKRPGPEPAAIGVEFMANAIALVRDYFYPHARAALKQIGLSERHATARRVLNWIRAHRKLEVSVLDVRQDALARTLDAEHTVALLKALERFGWVRESPAPSVRRRGKPVRRWEVNPALFGGADAPIQ